MSLEKLTDEELKQYHQMYQKGLHYSKRFHDRKKDLISWKSASHVVRLCLQAQQILEEKTLDLGRNKVTLLEIKAGKWSVDQIEDFFNEKEIYLNKLYEESDLRYSVDKDFIRDLLVKCINMHYADIPYDTSDVMERTIRKIQDLVENL